MSKHQKIKTLDKSPTKFLHYSYTRLITTQPPQPDLPTEHQKKVTRLTNMKECLGGFWVSEVIYFGCSLSDLH